MNDISGEFRQFELSVILGHSGCGKTTLLNILSTYINKNYSGTLEIDGKKVTSKVIQENSSYVMQEYNFHGFITVRESMMFTVNCKFNTRLDETTKRMKASRNEKIKVC